jgi:uncharacterized protein involved in propanediol utilization
VRRPQAGARHASAGTARGPRLFGPITPTRAVSVSGHFGELIQGRLGPNGPVALVTLPAPVLTVTARLAPGPLALYCAGGERPLTLGQVVALARALGAPRRGRLTLRASMPAGGGAGSSTAALLAAALLLADRPPPPDRLGRLCLALEGATDPLMHPEPARLLWAPREARILDRLPPLPPLELVGGFLGPGERTDPADHRFADVTDLVAAWSPAVARGDAAALAALATESARRNAAPRGGPDLAPLLAAAERHGALGVVAAHTGSARGLIFAPGRGDPAAAADTLRAAGLRGVRRFRLPGAALTIQS